MKYDQFSNYPLSIVSKIGIGGICPHYYVVYDEEAMCDIVALCRSLNYAYYIIGNASKILFSDGICPYVIIKNNINYLTIDENVIKVGAGYLLPMLCSRLIDLGFVGFAELSDIPGSIGGAIVMNAGANGKAISDYLESVEVLIDDKKVTIEKNELIFNYRYSSFQTNNYVILGATFKCQRGDSDVEIKKRDKYRIMRKERQPIANLSLGSTFINSEGKSIGNLIELMGLKGLHVGDAKISEKHGNFIVNNGKASAKNVALLIDIMTNKLYNTHRISPKLEIIILRW